MLASKSHQLPDPQAGLKQGVDDRDVSRTGSLVDFPQEAAQLDIGQRPRSTWRLLRCGHRTDAAVGAFLDDAAGQRPIGEALDEDELAIDRRGGQTARLQRHLVSLDRVAIEVRGFERLAIRREPPVAKTQPVAAVRRHRLRTPAPGDEGVSERRECVRCVRAEAGRPRVFATICDGTCFVFHGRVPFLANPVCIDVGAYRTQGRRRVAVISSVSFDRSVSVVPGLFDRRLSLAAERAPLGAGCWPAPRCSCRPAPGFDSGSAVPSRARSRHR